MNLSVKPRLECRFQLDIGGGITTSIFPEAERMLLENTAYWNALCFIACRKRMDRYISVIDFLFCELYPRFQRPCARFYEGNGPLLKDVLSDTEIDHYGCMLVYALRCAHHLYDQHRRLSWQQYRIQLHKGCL